MKTESVELSHPNYHLVAIMSHLGSSSSSGHYICFMKRQDKVRWADISGSRRMIRKSRKSLKNCCYRRRLTFWCMKMITEFKRKKIMIKKSRSWLQRAARLLYTTLFKNRVDFSIITNILKKVLHWGSWRPDNQCHSWQCTVPPLHMILPLVILSSPFSSCSRRRVRSRRWLLSTFIYY